MHVQRTAFTSTGRNVSACNTCTLPADCSTASFPPDPPATTFFPSTYTPSPISSASSTPYTLALRVTTTTAATITGIQFYKVAGSSGTHVGTVWRESDQAALGSVTFTGETATGWQTAMLATGVPVVPGQTYRVAYTAPSGNFGYLVSWPGITVAPFTALSGGAGVVGVSGYPTDLGTAWNLIDIIWTVP
jgi:hypothetical protein